LKHCLKNSIARFGWGLASLTGDEEVAQDVTQESLLAIARSIRKLNDPARFQAWGFQIVSNKSRDWIRRRGRERRNIEAAQQSTEPEALAAHWQADAGRKGRICAPPQSQQDRRADKQPLKKRIPVSCTPSIPAGPTRR